MSTTTTFHVRPLAAGLAAVALAAASTLLVTSPASAANEYIAAAQIAPDDTSYLGWHLQLGDHSKLLDAWNGLRTDAAGDVYALKGLVATGAPGLIVGASALGALITGSVITGTGDLLLEVPYSVTDVGTHAILSWGTLRTAAPVVSGVSPSPSTLFMSSQVLGAIPANTARPLSDFVTALDSLSGNVRYSGYGFYASAQFPAAKVQSIAFNGDVTSFGRGFVQTTPTSTVAVKQSDIRPDESTYTGWHEGYTNATPAYAVKPDGLHLGLSADSQIINGFAAPLTSDPWALMGSYAVTVVSGAAFAQLPVFYGSGTAFTTLRSAAGYGPGRTAPVPGDMWQSSRAIPATATTAAIPADTSVSLGDLLEALAAHGNTRVLAFGVLAQASDPTVVSAIAFNGVNYTFARAPEIAATGSEAAVPVSITAGALLLLGAALLLFRRRATR